MAKDKNKTSYYSPDGWFLNFLFMGILLCGLFAATVLVQRRAGYINKAAEVHNTQQMEYESQNVEEEMMIYP